MDSPYGQPATDYRNAAPNTIVVNQQTPIPNPQSPIPNHKSPISY